MKDQTILDRYESALREAEQMRIIAQQRVTDRDQADDEVIRLQKLINQQSLDLEHFSTTVANQHQQILTLQNNLKTAERVKAQLSTRIKNMRAQING